ncbi:hypothetical protein FE633_34055 [Streptomyces montanus]|uniref:Uncharacterized protein n=1 Tax=Streptomyces montanus TaxID=2580423 RepID=A0A5R9FMS1_9ACTN|nr:hypothetical protein [Streptomyces montanus]TLS41834.1 hypothetical protein FE633_34055 [Streptomyces montanus]
MNATMRNEVLGVPVGAPPERWEEGLGGDFLDDVQKSRMRRDYGLVEVAFTKRDGHWESVSASLQIHRLARGLEGMVPAPLERAYGKFQERVGFDPFRTVLQARGGALEEVADASMAGFGHFRETTAHSSVYVVNDPPHGDLRSGALWSIVLSRCSNP